MKKLFCFFNSLFYYQEKQGSQKRYDLYKRIHNGNSIITTLISQPDSPFFTVYKWEIHDQTSLDHEHGPYTLVSIIDGNGILTVDDQQYSLHKGDHFIIPATVKSWTMDGELLAIASELTD